MLPRTLEPEVMDSPEEARDYDSMDHAAVNDLFVADFLADVGRAQPDPRRRHGHGPNPDRLVPKISRRRASSPWTPPKSMLAVGRENVAARRDGGSDSTCGSPTPNGCRSRIPTFAAVMSNSIVHHIPEPAAVVAEMVRVLQPGGRIFVRDLLRPADGATFATIVESIRRRRE